MKRLVLGSASPRRAFLLKECGFQFEIRPSHAAEDFDPLLPAETIPGLLALRKWTAGSEMTESSTCLLTADTIVLHRGKILNKPSDEAEAIQMLSELSGSTHTVITGVCMGMNNSTPVQLNVRSSVTFHNLSRKSILQYVQTFRPMDKAGAYGAQECLAVDNDPCSPEELALIRRLGLGDIIERSKPAGWKSAPMTAIKYIEGPYFNVMGLPVAELYDTLRDLLA
ncbi:MAG: Maf family protein [Bacteroidota bacterium]